MKILVSVSAGAISKNKKKIKKGCLGINNLGYGQWLLAKWHHSRSLKASRLGARTTESGRPFQSHANSSWHEWHLMVICTRKWDFIAHAVYMSWWSPLRTNELLSTQVSQHSIALKLSHFTHNLYRRGIMRMSTRRCTHVDVCQHVDVLFVNFAWFCFYYWTLLF